MLPYDMISSKMSYDILDMVSDIRYENLSSGVEWIKLNQQACLHCLFHGEIPTQCSNVTYWHPHFHILSEISYSHINRHVLSSVSYQYGPATPVMLLEVMLILSPCEYDNTHTIMHTEACMYCCACLS